MEINSFIFITFVTEKDLIVINKDTENYLNINIILKLFK